MILFDWPLAMWVGVPALVVVIVVVTIMFAGRRSGRAARRATSIVAAVAGTASLLLAANSVVAIVGYGVQAFASPTISFADAPLSSAKAPDFVRDTSAIVDGRYSALWVEVTGLDAGTRWAIWLRDALPWVAALAIAIALVWLAVRVVRRRPFGRRLPIAIGISAIAVMVGGIGTQICAASAQRSLLAFLGMRGTTSGCNEAGGCESMASVLNLDSSPVLWALGLALVAAAFQYGTHLQRDTEGLV